MIDREAAAELDELAEAIARIRPMSYRNPHAFYEERSEVASRIRAIATRFRTGVRPADGAEAPPPPAKPARIVHTEIRIIEGRSVRVCHRARGESFA